MAPHERFHLSMGPPNQQQLLTHFLHFQPHRPSTIHYLGLKSDDINSFPLIYISNILLYIVDYAMYDLVSWHSLTDFPTL